MQSVNILCYLSLQFHILYQINIENSEEHQDAIDHDPVMDDRHFSVEIGVRSIPQAIYRKSENDAINENFNHLEDVFLGSSIDTIQVHLTVFFNFPFSIVPSDVGINMLNNESDENDEIVLL